MAPFFRTRCILFTLYLVKLDKLGTGKKGNGKKGNGKKGNGKKGNGKKGNTPGPGKKGNGKKGNLSLLTCSNTDQCLEPDMNNNARSLHHNSYGKSKKT